MYLADCNECESIYHKPQYDSDGKRIDGTEPAGATGWYFGASGASYTGTDYTDPDPNALPPSAWGQRGANEDLMVKKASLLAQPPTYIEGKYVDCMRCGCPLNHVDNKDWSCELAVEVSYPENSRFEPITMYIVQNRSEAIEEMVPNVAKLLKKINLIKAYEDILYYGEIGSTGSGATGASGATGYYIIDGQTGAVVGAIGSSSFTSAYTELAHPTRIPVTDQERRWYEEATDDLYDELRQMVGVTTGQDGFADYSNIQKCNIEDVTKKRAVFEISGDCSGEDPEPEDATDCYNSYSWWYWRNDFTSFFSNHDCDEFTDHKACCCSDCSKTFTRDEGIDITDSWFETAKIKTTKKTFKITAEDVSCEQGSCHVNYIITPSVEAATNWKLCSFPGTIRLISPKEADEANLSEAEKAYFTYNTRLFIGGYGGSILPVNYQTANLCPIHKFDLAELCGTEDNPDVYGGNGGSNRTNYQYDYTLDNNQYP
jgi:hypothetical protein